MEKSTYKKTLCALTLLLATAGGYIYFDLKGNKTIITVPPKDPILNTISDNMGKTIGNAIGEIIVPEKPFTDAMVQAAYDAKKAKEAALFPNKEKTDAMLYSKEPINQLRMVELFKQMKVQMIEYMKNSHVEGALEEAELLWKIAYCYKSNIIDIRGLSYNSLTLFIQDEVGAIAMDLRFIYLDGGPKDMQDLIEYGENFKNLALGMK